MKKLLSFIFLAFLTSTISAQDSEYASVNEYSDFSSYLTVNFSSAGDISPVIGLALTNDFIIFGSTSGGAGGLQTLILDFGSRVFISDYFIQAEFPNVITSGVNDFTIGFGKLHSLNAITDKLFIESGINYALDSGLNTFIGFGARF